MSGDIVGANLTPPSLHFGDPGKEVLRITNDGELIFADASEAAQALMDAWSELRHKWKAGPSDEIMKRARPIVSWANAYEGERADALAKIPVGVLRAAAMIVNGANLRPLIERARTIHLEMRDINIGQAGYRTPGQIADAAWFTGQPNPGRSIPS